MRWIRAHLAIVVPAAIAVVAVIAYLAFGVFGVQFLFIDDTVDEAAPVFASGAAASDATPVPPSDAPVSTAADDGATTTRPAEPSEASAGASDTTAPPATPARPAANDTTDTTDTTAAPPPTTAPPTPQVVTVVEGTFIPRDHPGSGVATVLTDGSSQRFLRFEQFATDNGPDLNVYLTAADAEGPEGAFDDDFVDLGNLKGNIGDQNYEIPPDVDLERYDTVVVWCVRFSSAFTAADLAPV